MKNIYKEEIKFVMNLALEFRLSLKNVCLFFNANPTDENQQLFYNEMIKNAGSVVKIDELKYLTYETANESEKDSKTSYNLALTYYSRYLNALKNAKSGNDLNNEKLNKAKNYLQYTDVEFEKLNKQGFKKVAINEAIIIAKYRIKHVISKIQFAEEFGMNRETISRWEKLITNPRLVNKIKSLNDYNYELSIKSVKASNRKK